MRKIHVKIKPLYRMVSHLLLPKINRPSYADTLKFPDELSSLTPVNITDLMGRYTGILAYAHQDLSELNRESLRLDARERERRFEMMQANPRLNTLEKHKREAFYEADKAMRQIWNQRTYVNMSKEHTMMFMANYERYVAALSRDLTRRSLTDEKSRRWT